MSNVEIGRDRVADGWSLEHNEKRHGRHFAALLLMMRLSSFPTKWCSKKQSGGWTPVSGCSVTVLSIYLPRGNTAARRPRRSVRRCLPVALAAGAKRPAFGSLKEKLAVRVSLRSRSWSGQALEVDGSESASITYRTKPRLLSNVQKLDTANGR